jgi:hypothetical protein
VSASSRSRHTGGAPFDVHEGRRRDGRAEGRPRLHPQRMAPLVAVLDRLRHRLRQAHPVGQAQRWASASAGAHRTALGAPHLLAVPSMWTRS